MNRKPLFESPALPAGLCALLLAACSAQGVYTGALAGGTLVLSVAQAGAAARSITSDVSPTTSYYLISGAGPADSSFSGRIPAGAGACFVQDDLMLGEWTIAAAAYNASDVELGSGQTAVAIRSGATIAASVTILPGTGQGTLSLSLSWPTAALALPSLVASLVPTGGGAAIDLAPDFPVDAGAKTAGYSKPLDPGSYALAIQLLDGATAVYGWADSVQIVSDGTSAASFSYAP